MTEIKGIDVSSYQGKINWETVSNYGMGFAILRITEKGNVVDNTFEANYKGCVENKIPVGVYKYSYATTIEQIKEEANIVIKTLNKRGLDYPVFLDLEDKCQENIASTVMMQMIDSFREIIVNAGYKFGIYCGKNWYETKLPEGAKKYDCWLASYPSNDNGTLQERLRPTVGIGWQYSSKATIPGISEKVDRNVFYKDYSSQKEEANMGYDINKVIQIATNEIGYLEKKSNANLDSKTGNAGSNNYTKYWRDMANLGLGNYQAQYWCACFVHWCFYKAYGLAASQLLLLQKFFINCQVMYNLATSKKQIYTTPKVGDVVLFWTSSTAQYGHTGIVVSVSTNGKSFTTIEGNTSGGSTVVANGGGVAKKTYILANLTKPRFVRPNYGTSTTTTSSSTTTSTTKTYLEFGDSGAEVKSLQQKLNKLGYKGKDGKALTEDGSFGSNTDFAVRAFQKAQKLTVDGQAGKNTLAALDAAVEALTKSQANSTTSDGWIGEVTATELNVRSWAGAEYPTIKSYPKLGKGNRIRVLSSLKANDGSTWYKIAINNAATGNKDVIGFVAAKYIKKV